MEIYGNINLHVKG